MFWGTAKIVRIGQNPKLIAQVIAKIAIWTSNVLIWTIAVSWKSINFVAEKKK